MTNIRNFLTLEYTLENNFLKCNFKCCVYLCITMIDAPKPAPGRPTKDRDRLKKSRTLSFTDAEYAKLGELAKAAKLGRSEYIIEKLGLDK
jgi:hypothetical protein